MSRLLFASVFASHVLGHGHVSNIVVNGVSYQGWDVNSFPYMEEVPLVASWGTPNTGGGWPDSGYSDPDIICHIDAVNGEGSIPVAAGDSISLQWTQWPDTHHGPVIDYLANCGSSCQTVDKTTLEFFKISEVGLVDDTTVPGFWATDELIENNSSWLVQIPETVAPGDYVLRHELIALQGAHTEGGAQNYMQCINLQITGSGSAQPEGVLATDLYTSTDSGILVDIFKPLTYTIPGPSLIAGATPVAQATSAITSSGTAIVPGATSA
ncbi:lytic polysaccharide monooxygenase auxiliary activity family 9 protein [Aspergillus lucknowensis]|uniref:AA9 family lytic polysaccharide monooxygenase n=1 Tax=Aspergillus lucknowensis TaxID=176173 RepID=A0ABR4M6X8_9EURO